MEAEREQKKMAEKKLQNGNKFKTKTRLEGSRLQAARRLLEATASRPSGAYKWHGHMINTGSWRRSRSSNWSKVLVGAVVLRCPLPVTVACSNKGVMPEKVGTHTRTRTLTHTNTSNECASGRARVVGET